MMGLTVIGSLWWATVRDHADADEPRESGSEPAVATNQPERYVMLTDGKMVRGTVTEEGNEYLVGQSVGVMHFAKQRTEGVFNTIHDAYLYRLEQLPDRDSDERMKLAQWCLNLKLRDEAREQLKKVLEVNKKHPQARAMMASMDQAAAIVAQRQRDPQVRQTAAETMNENRPGALDSAVIQGAQRKLNVLGMPVIFDLPTPLAIKKTHEFVQFINPVLQAYCARCHDGNYRGEFQLVPMNNRSERTADAYRANLDATLRIIDPENPSKSELLTTTLRAHGPGPRPRSIFPGSNDKTYQILAAWAQSLRRPAQGAAGTYAPGQLATETDDDFAVNRDRGDSAGPASAPSASANEGQRARPVPGISPGLRIPPPSRYVPGGAKGPKGANQAAPDEFPMPFVLTGKMPAMAESPTVSNRPARSSANRGTAPASASAGTATSPTQAPAGPADAGDQAEPSEEPAAPRKKAKPLKIDPALLERALQNRNGPH